MFFRYTSLFVREIWRVGSHILIMLSKKNIYEKRMRGLQPYNLIDAITGPGRSFGGFGHVRVHSMIITLRAYLYVHVSFIIRYIRNVMRKNGLVRNSTIIGL